MAYLSIMAYPLPIFLGWHRFLFWSLHCSNESWRSCHTGSSETISTKPSQPPQRPTCTKRREKDNEWRGRLVLGFIGQANSLWCETPFWWWAVWGRCCKASHSLHSGDPGGGTERGEWDTLREKQDTWSKVENNLFLSGKPLVDFLVRGHRGNRSFDVLRHCGTLAEQRV